MTLKQLLISVFVATAVCWLGWALVLLQIDPTANGIGGLFIFYLCLFFALCGTFFLISFGIRKIFNRSDLEYRIVATSFRQSFFFALLINGVLFLQSKNLLTWWNIILLVLGLSILEFFFLSYKKTNI